jgi:predicted Zn finger-like uncharacterized protein
VIISCKNCDKKFEVDSSLIPEKGRLLECNSCNYKWFFKKDIINESVLPIKTKDQIKKDKTNQDKNKDPRLDPSKNKKNYNFLSLILIFIISFIALIILLDTFQAPISKIVPDIEFILYNLYETINDISLFFKDLI